MYLRAQQNSHERSWLWEGMKERTGRDTEFTKPLYDHLSLA